MDEYILWGIYVAALQAQKQRKHAPLTETRRWREDINAVRATLYARGLVL